MVTILTLLKAKAQSYENTQQYEIPINLVTLKKWPLTAVTRVRTDSNKANTYQNDLTM